MKKKFKFMFISLLMLFIFFIQSNVKTAKSNSFVADNADHSNNSVTSNDNHSYKYKLTLTGIMPNAEAESTFTVLTNDKNLTFESLVKSILSSDSEDALDIQILPD